MWVKLLTVVLAFVTVTCARPVHYEIIDPLYNSKWLIVHQVGFFQKDGHQWSYGVLLANRTKKTLSIEYEIASPRDTCQSRTQLWPKAMALLDCLQDTLVSNKRYVVNISVYQDTLGARVDSFRSEKLYSAEEILNLTASDQLHVRGFK